MSMVNKSHSDLLYLLMLLSKKREDLLSPFLDNSINEWIGLSFKYEGNQEAFNLVKERFVTLWIDSHITQIIEAMFLIMLDTKQWNCFQNIWKPLILNSTIPTSSIHYLKQN